jgi:LPPG:FO 2-phospho-L-lactate transferase
VGDRDLATHVTRSHRLWAGQRLTDVTRTLCAALGVGPVVLPMSDQWVRTLVDTSEGELEFQEYFVHRRCEPRVTGFRFKGLEAASATPEVLDALAAAGVVVLCPSNPFVSIEPILRLPGVREALQAAATTRGRAAVAVSPIVGGQALKGPAAKMLAELGLEVSARAVAERYRGLISGYVMDRMDAALAPDIESLGLALLLTDTIMRSENDRARLAEEVLRFASGQSQISKR